MTDLWKTLAKSHSETKDRAILDLFGNESRATDFSARLGDMLFDYSKTNIDTVTRDQLLALAIALKVAAKRDAMFAGAVINETEGRSVLHTALRNLNDPVILDGIDVMPAVRATHTRMEAFCDDVRPAL
jgi:glucose-6-phosphate isomerase